jgi:hypothetical protein
MTIEMLDTSTLFDVRHVYHLKVSVEVVECANDDSENDVLEGDKENCSTVCRFSIVESRERTIMRLATIIFDIIFNMSSKK